MVFPLCLLHIAEPMNSTRTTRRRNKLHKPRNPLVAPVMQRKAGRHRKSGKATRRAEKMALRQDTERMSA